MRHVKEAALWFPDAVLSLKAAAGVSVSPVAELLGQVDVQDVRQDGDELRGITEGGADGVSRVDVVQLCRGQRSRRQEVSLPL